jgi:hypothetical protein
LKVALSVEHEGAMAESIDQRIENILRKKAKEKQAAEQEKSQAERRSNEHQATAEHVRRKWTADAHIIAEILKDFEQKMSPLGLQLAFQDAGQKGDALAVGRIVGRVSGSDLQVMLNVDPNGEIHAFQGPKAGHIAVQFTSPSKLSVLTADRAQYEALILDFIERAPDQNRRPPQSN